jgi:hypothetical protein
MLGPGKRGLWVSRSDRNNRRFAMSQLQVADKTVAADAEGVSSAYAPPLQRTEGQPPPVAANGRPVLNVVRPEW